MPDTYHDYPACLFRYAWLIEDRAAAVDDVRGRLFTSTTEPWARCKACGAAVHPGEQRNHVRHEQRTLKQLRRKRAASNKAEAAARLRIVNRHRGEARNAA